MKTIIFILDYPQRRPLTNNNNTRTFLQTGSKQLWELLGRQNPLNESEVIAVTHAQILDLYTRRRPPMGEMPEASFSQQILPILKPCGSLNDFQRFEETVDRFRGEVNDLNGRVRRVEKLEASQDHLKRKAEELETSHKQLETQLEEVQRIETNAPQPKRRTPADGSGGAPSSTMRDDDSDGEEGISKDEDYE
ncbi:hypothetical protein PROFUN_04822 [Planoprotostelium fungivorum]|uniref:Uncharacterized protein n=1 Tax=Planoprotostelium fungivorum TaxID=1890364 RepID=A0A2P6NT04_9EUKA|nr:hypothetical protein PROFUN_04822 [Planoprotostelium fungivorum]